MYSHSTLLFQRTLIHLSLNFSPPHCLAIFPQGNVMHLLLEGCYESIVQMFQRILNQFISSQNEDTFYFPPCLLCISLIHFANSQIHLAMAKP